MQISTASEKLRLMHLIEMNVRDVGITATTDEGSLCFYRPVYDKSSATTYGMTSAINTFQRGNCFRRVYCVEQSDSTEQLVKFSIQLKDEIGQLLGQWDLDLTHGLHTHPIEDGTKGKEHVPFMGGIVDVALEIAAQIKGGI
jgi:hypothetical protein